jgi:hypothetical protein
MKGNVKAKTLILCLILRIARLGRLLIVLILNFEMDPRSVHLGLSTDGFQPHSTNSHLYSCWPVFMMPYNLPPDKCLKEGFIFFALVISGPKEPKKQINIFLQPLFEELKNLWSGVDAYDSHLKYRFNLRVAYL